MSCLCCIHWTREITLLPSSLVSWWGSGKARLMCYIIAPDAQARRRAWLRGSLLRPLRLVDRTVWAGLLVSFPGCCVGSARQRDHAKLSLNSTWAHKNTQSRSKNNKCGLILSKKKVDKRCENGSAESISPPSQLVYYQPGSSMQVNGTPC